MAIKKIVFVGLSGGVDSAVSAVLLLKQGYEVVGVFIKTWHPDFLECNEEEERHDAMRVAAHLNIPFLTFDFEKEYKKEVADYMISEYRKGRTPNPDVMCNKEVKFGAFLKKALSMGADFVATGHYADGGAREALSQPAQMLQRRSGLFLGASLSRGKLLTAPSYAPAKVSPNPLLLRRGIDPAKDQSYFLWTLNQKQLSKILFPIGHLKKTEVRKLAKKLKLPIAEKKDSQGICFLGDVDLNKFLKHYIKEKRGKVINTDGEVIGHHDGVFFHTLGKRHGFTITKKKPNDGPYYIVGKDIKKNILIVSQDKNYSKKGLASATGTSTRNFLVKKYPYPFEDGFCVNLNNVNWISGIPQKNKKYFAQIRYHGELISCKVETKKSTAKIIFEKPILVASGQSCVIYDGDICLGGGVVV